MRWFACLLLFLSAACVPKFDKSTECDFDNDCFKGEYCDQILLICVVEDAALPPPDSGMDASDDGADGSGGSSDGGGGEDGSGGAGGAGGMGGVDGGDGGTSTDLGVMDGGSPPLTLCGACTSDEDCAALGESTRCVPFQEGQFCLRTCASEESACPLGYVCDAQNLFCLPQDGSCIACGERDCPNGQICDPQTNRCGPESGPGEVDAGGAMDMGVPSDAGPVDAGGEMGAGGRGDDSPRPPEPPDPSDGT